MESPMDIRKKELSKIAERHNINVLFDEDWDGCVPFNQASSSGDLIVMNTFNNIDNFTIAFFHELAHCLRSRDKMLATKYNIRLLEESYCWTNGIWLADLNGYRWEDPHHPVWSYVYRCIFSYIFTEYDDCYRKDISVKAIHKDIENWLERSRTEDRGIKKDK